MGDTVFLRRGNKKRTTVYVIHKFSSQPLELEFLPFIHTGREYDDDLNDEISVQQILRDMLDKKVVEKDILNDLGFDGSKKRKDPRPKMELRHKQVSLQIMMMIIIIIIIIIIINKI